MLCTWPIVSVTLIALMPPTPVRVPVQAARSALAACRLSASEEEFSEEALLSMSEEDLLALADENEMAASEVVHTEPPEYRGLTPPAGEPLRNIVCTVELPDVGVAFTHVPYVHAICSRWDTPLSIQSRGATLLWPGLVFEVADSLASGGDGRAGRGLFVRIMDDIEAVTLGAGTAVCGYAVGKMATEADSLGGKTVGFHLRETGTSFFFEQQLHTVASCLAPGSGVEAIVGHVIHRDADTGEVTAIEADEGWEGQRCALRTWIRRTSNTCPTRIRRIRVRA